MFICITESPTVNLKHCKSIIYIIKNYIYNIYDFNYNNLLKNYNLIIYIYKEEKKNAITRNRKITKKTKSHW